MLLKAQEILPQIKNCEPSEHGQVIHISNISTVHFMRRQKFCNIFWRMWSKGCKGLPATSASHGSHRAMARIDGFAAICVTSGATRSSQGNGG